MKTREGAVIETKADCQGKEGFSSRRRYWLVIAGLWLQIVVVIFIVMHFKHHVHTPVRDWMSRIMQLFGE
jgi:uncharacterized membrane protein YhaH (DUF805 family)